MAQVLRDRRLKAEFLIWLTLHETVEDAEIQQGGWVSSPQGGKNIALPGTVGCRPLQASGVHVTFSHLPDFSVLFLETTSSDLFINLVGMSLLTWLCV